MKITKNRKTTTPLKVCVLPEERTFIQEQAKLCCRTTSTYLRDLALGYQPQSKTDSDVVIELMSVNANLARLGNLLKLWLADDKKAQGFNNNFSFDALCTYACVLLRKIIFV